MAAIEPNALYPVERVRCLSCRVTYLKPCGGNVAVQNPGCPRCGYLGWISAFVPLDGADRHRSGAYRHLHPPSQLH